MSTAVLSIVSTILIASLAASLVMFNVPEPEMALPSATESSPTFNVRLFAPAARLLLTDKAPLVCSAVESLKVVSAPISIPPV